MTGAGVDKGTCVWIEQAQKSRDEAGHVLLHQKPVGLTKDETGAAKLMSKSMNSVLYERGDAGGLHPMPGHIPNEQSHLSVLGREHIVEVTPYLGLYRCRAVKVTELDSRELLRDIEQGILQPPEERVLLFEKTGGLLLRTLSSWF